MKKLFFSLVALLAVMTMQAQSICGSWQSMKPVVQDHDDGYFMLSYIYTFHEDGTFVTDIDLTISSKPEQTKEREIALSGNLLGTYTLKGNKLTMYFNANSFNLDVISVSQNGVVLDLPEGMKPSIKEKINREAKAKAAEAFTEETYTVKFTANGSMLELTDAKKGETERLMRMATLKE